MKTHGQLSFCSGNSGDPIFTETFGTGIDHSQLPTGTTTYAYSNDFPSLLDGSYTVFNGTNGSNFDWHLIEDHTIGDTNGKLLLINADANPGEFYRVEINGLCENTTYEFSAWLINLVIAGGFCTTQPGGIIPNNVTFEIRNGSDTVELGSGDTGDIIESADANWNEYGLVFNTGNETSVILRMINNGAGGCGNDLAIDDIEFKSCGDTATTEDSENNDFLTVCSGETPYALELTALPDGSVYNTYFYQWQESADGATWNDISGANNQNVALSVTTSGYFRAKIAEAAVNLNNDQCISFSDEYQATIVPGEDLPLTACWQTATLDPATCTWQITGTQPVQPPTECYETATFNDTSCAWEITGTLPAQPVDLECWETIEFNDATCAWDISGAQPVAPTNLECWETVEFNATSCSWEIIGMQPAQPLLECWETATFNPTSCAWDLAGTQPAQPDVSTLECWETSTFDETSCTWTITGDEPLQPALSCWETIIFNAITCDWDVTGDQPAQPDNLECWETASFNEASCSWEVAGAQPTAPVLECWQNSAFNTATCAWEVMGAQPVQPTTACWQTAVFDDISCTWSLMGTQPEAPEPATLACGETAIFNPVSCIWEVSGNATESPNIQCYETAVFNELSCFWDISGTQPEQPTTECWEIATFNTVSCSWDITGIQEIQPVLGCGEVASFNTTECIWEISGGPTQAPETECFETAFFNPASCVWEIVGIQPEQPALACGEIAAFDSTTCSWEVSVNPIDSPNTACYETATFNDATCSWIVTGSQPEIPLLQDWETATFNTTSCSWAITGSPIVEIMQQSLFLCDGGSLVLQPNTNIEMPVFLWNTGATTGEITIDSPGVFAVDIGTDDNTLERIIYTVGSVEAPRIASVVSNGSDITVTTDNPGDYLYSLDGISYQSNNAFYGVAIGMYTIYVKEDACERIENRLHYHFDVPKFFTPNNDGVNDTFVLLGIQNLGAYHMAIYDRYGNLLLSRNNGPFEWDGTYNGKRLPSDDYWYHIRIEGQKISGHFTLKR